MASELFDEVSAIRSSVSVDANAAAAELVRAVIDLRVAALMADGARSIVGIKARLLRAEGVSWTVIGDACGISRQAAQQRFGTKSCPQSD